MINGDLGFRGQLEGCLLQNNGVFLEGKGGTAEFIMVATQTGPDHYRCFRRFKVKQPMKLWGTEVPPGTYFATTEDQLMHSADQPPAELKAPLTRGCRLTELAPTGAAHVRQCESPSYFATVQKSALGT